MAKIYVGNLPFTATEAEVRTLFAEHGTVESVSLPTDRETGRPRGFGFVEMSQADAARAIQNLNGKELGGRLAQQPRDQDQFRIKKSPDRSGLFLHFAGVTSGHRRRHCRHRRHRRDSHHRHRHRRRRRDSHRRRRRRRCEAYPALR